MEQNPTHVTNIDQEHEVEKPKKDMSFQTLGDAYTWLQKYARSMGFAYVKFTRSTNEEGDVIRQQYSCHKAGVRKPRNLLKQKVKPCLRINCPAKVSVLKGKDGRWRIRTVELVHNHDMDPDNSRFIIEHRQLPPKVKRRLEYMDTIGVQTSKVIKATAIEYGGPSNMPCLPRDCRNHIDKVRRARIQGSDAEAVYLLFTRMQKASRDFFFKIDVDEDNRMRNVFWVDERSRAAYKEYNDVNSLDSTYLLNKYKMPFTPFVGVNHHGQSILLGCALITHEDVRTYEWLFTAWLEAMGGKAPGAIITDQCQSIGNAIERVFPNSRHRWCLWHILIKFPEKIGGHRRYDALRETFMDVIYETLTVDEFVSKWEHMITEFELEGNDWFASLFRGREKWAPVLVKDQFWAGMSSTQRSEGMNAYFNDYVHSKTSLRTFVEQFDLALGDKIEKEEQADAECMKGDVRCQTKLDMELQFQKVYTHNLFRKVQDELIAMVYCEADLVIEDSFLHEYNVTEKEKIGGGRVRTRDFKVVYDSSSEEVKCICRLFDWKGILCRHAFRVLFKRNVTVVPEKYILRRWRKDVKREHSKIKLLGVGNKWTSEMERMKILERFFYSAADHVVDGDDKCQFLSNIMKEAEKQLVDGSWSRSSCATNTEQVEELGEVGDYDEYKKRRFKYKNPKVANSRGRPSNKAKSLGQILKTGKGKKIGGHDDKVQDHTPRTPAARRPRKKKDETAHDSVFEPTTSPTSNDLDDMQRATMPTSMVENAQLMDSPQNQGFYQNSWTSLLMQVEQGHDMNWGTPHLTFSNN